MQIGGLSQCFRRQKVEKRGKKRDDKNIIRLITMGYESFS